MGLTGPQDRIVCDLANKLLFLAILFNLMLQLEDHYLYLEPKIDFLVSSGQLVQLTNTSVPITFTICM